MTAITHEDKVRADTRVAQAMKAFQVTLVALEEALDKLRMAEKGGEQGVIKDLRAMNGAFVLAMQMEEKAREAEFGKGGGARDGELDLDAARAEIGLRLACLRTAGEGGGVSGGAE